VVRGNTSCTYSFRNEHMKRSIVAKSLATGNILVFESAMEASKQYGFDESHIIKCCRGRRKQHKGYTWSYYLPIKSILL